MFNKLKNWIKRTIERYKNRKTLSKIKYNLQQSENILEEKGYRSNEQHYDYSCDTIHIYLHNKPLFLVKGASYEKGTITLHFNNSIANLLEASLILYCWTCLLPELPGSRYQQYIRRCEGYVNG